MSIATINVPTAGQPRVVSLPTSHLACRGCGIAVPADNDAVHVSLGRRWERVPGSTEQRAVAEWLALGTCERCAAIRSKAAAAVDAHRVLQHQLGGVVLERVEGALLALDLLDSPLPELRSTEEVLQLVGYLHGAGIAFEALQQPGVCSSSRWAHVPEEARASLRDAAARWMRARLAKPVGPLRTPVDSAVKGCAYCGVSSSATWSSALVSARSLGGSPTPSYPDVDLCTGCAAAVQAVGSVGRSSMLRSVLDFLGLRDNGGIGEVVDVHMRGFAIVPGAKPSTERWAFLDLEALRDGLRGLAVSS